MMDEMMQQCCDENGKPDFDKMKRFMESCSMKGLSEEQMAMMKEFCSGQGVADMAKMKEMMEKCGCRPSGS